MTKTVVEAIEPPETGYIIVWDVPRAGERRGLGIRVNSGGARTYFVQDRLPGGREVKPTIGRHGKPWTTDQARAKGQALLGAIVAGVDPTEEKRAARKAERLRQDGAGDREVRAVAGRWFANQRRNGIRSADEVERSFERHVYPELGTRSIESITKVDAYALYERLADAGHAPMGHQLVRNLRALLSFADEPLELITVNPLLRIKLPPLESRDRTLIKFHPEQEPDPAELVAVLRAADQLPEPQRTYIYVLTLTLAREDEIGDIPYTELVGGVWQLPAARHKGKRSYDIPLSTQTLELIEALPKEREVAGRMIRNEFVFSGRGDRPIGDFSGIKADLDRLSGVTNWRLHDLRRSGASWIEERFGAEVMHAALGHSLGKRLTKTYAHGSGHKRKRRALQSWANFVWAALERRR